MKHQLKKFVSTLMILSTSFSLTGLGLVSSAHAALVTASSATLTDVRSLTSSNHTVAFHVVGTTNVKAIKLQYRTQASIGSAVPTSLVTSAASLPGASNDTITVNSTPATGWTLDKSTPGTFLITNSSGTGTLVASDPISVEVDTITNNDATASGGGACDTVSNSETCYIRITTYSDTGATTPIDNGVVSYTVITPVTVTATVDPSLTMTVAGITSLATLNSNDANAACTGNDITATATTIPFSNIQVSVPECAQQSVSIATNAAGGYIAYAKFVGSTPATDMMQGTTTTNNIDPFTAGGATWGAPAVWADPTGAANVNSGYLGQRVKNPGSMSPDVSGFGTSNFYAPPAVTTAIGNQIMNNSTTDPGTSPTYVTYKIEAGPGQPADTYTGKVVYNAVATF